MSVSADTVLAARLERFAADDVRGFVRDAALLYPDSGADMLEVAGGVAGYLGQGSPANGAVGLGFAGEVTAAEIALVEAFFRSRSEQPIVAVCPLAHPSLASCLGSRGWVLGTFENVLVLDLASTDTWAPDADGVEVREASGESELDAWALLAARGFSAPEPPAEPELRLAVAASRRAGARFLYGVVDGEPAGTGQLEIDGDIAWLSGDSTLPHARRRGVQSSLQRARLVLARDAGCRMAVTESVPGSPSQRNMERLGFRVVYTRVDAVLSTPSTDSAPERTAP